MSLFEATLGFALCGVFISLFMFGVVTVQTFTYYRTFVNDKPALKILIALIWLLELGIAICISMGIYMMLVTNFGNILRLSQIPTSMITALILGGISCHLAQALFIYRIYVLSGKKIVFPIVFGGLSLFLLTIVFLSTAKAFTTVAVQPHSTEGEGFLSTLFIGSVIEDLSIAVFMCYFLRKQKKASLTSTGALLDRLFVFTVPVESCIITSMIAVCGAICFFTMPNNYAWMMFMILMHSFFSNSILSSLNNRASLAAMSENVIGFSGDFRSTANNVSHPTIIRSHFSAADTPELNTKIRNGAAKRIPPTEV